MNDRVPTRTPIRMISPQTYHERARALRARAQRLFNTASAHDNGQYSSRRHLSNGRALFDSLEKGRFQLGLSLSVLGDDGPYDRTENLYDARGEVELEPEADTASDMLDGDCPEVYMEMRRELATMIDELKEMHWKMQSALFEQWFYAHLERAVMHLSEARCHVGVILRERTDERTRRDLP